MENIDVINFTDLSLSELLEVCSSYAADNNGIKLDYYHVAEYGIDIRIIDIDSIYTCTYFLTYDFNNKCISQDCDLKLKVSKEV